MVSVLKYAIRFLAVAAAFLVLEESSFAISRQNCQRVWEKEDVLVTLPAKSQSIPRVTAQLSITLEEYDVTEKKVLSSSPFWDVRLAGLDEEQLRQFLKEPGNLGNEEDFDRGYCGTELISFDRTQVCIRKLYRRGKEKT